MNVNIYNVYGDEFKMVYDNIQRHLEVVIAKKKMQLNFFEWHPKQTCKIESMR
jgi:hypothetical protein